MTGVAVLTGNRFVLRAVRINLSRLIGMTFDAVAGTERRRRCGPAGGTEKHDRETKQEKQ
jgi:hypothetical protein